MCRCKSTVLIALLPAILLLAPGFGDDAPTGGTPPVFNPANKHYYQAVLVPGGLTWADARDAAAKRAYLGAKGYLATITSEAEYRFVTSRLRTDDCWIGAHQDRNAADYREPDGGWRWVTGEQWEYTFWNNGEPNDANGGEDVASFAKSGQRMNDQPGSAKSGGYLVEFATTGPDGSREQLLAAQDVGKFLKQTLQRYASLRSYSATVELVTKLGGDTIEAVRVELLVQPPNLFRLEGRGEKGKVLAAYDGRVLFLATTEPGQRMRYLTKPARVQAALRDAFSLLSTTGKPPSVTEFVLGAADPTIWSGPGYVPDTVSVSEPEQTIRSRVTVKVLGEAPVEGQAALTVSMREFRVAGSELQYRLRGLPITVREIHSGVKTDAPLPAMAFSFPPPAGAREVHDLGEGDEGLEIAPVTGGEK